MNILKHKTMKKTIFATGLGIILTILCVFNAKADVKSWGRDHDRDRHEWRERERHWDRRDWREHRRYERLHYYDRCRPRVYIY